MADKFKAILEINPNAKVEITNGQITNWYDTTPISDADISSNILRASGNTHHSNSTRTKNKDCRNTFTNS